MAITINLPDQFIGHSDGLPPGAYKATGAIFVADKTDYTSDPLKMKRCLGSGFLVHGYDFHFLTANHVVSEALQENEIYVLVLPNQISGEGLVSFPISSVTALENKDVAYGMLTEPEGDVSLYGFQLAQTVNASKDCANYEHSGSSCKPDGTIVFNVRLRKGYIVGQSKYEFDPIAGADILEMSYPCLKGASGSPVFEHTNLSVVGVMVQNVDHELAPTQLIRAVDDDGELIEEIKYSIPQGIAVSVETLSDHLNRHQLH